MEKEKGSVTLYTLMVMLFFIILILGIYTNTMRHQKIQAAAEQRQRELAEEQAIKENEIYEEVLEKQPDAYLTQEELSVYLTKVIEEKQKNSIDAIYPVGSIYITTENMNPKERFGGEWEAYGQGRTLIGAGTGTDSNNTKNIFTVGAIGGEYTHKLTVTEIASHNHSVQQYILGWKEWNTTTISGYYIRDYLKSGIKNTESQNVTDHIVSANFGVTSNIGGNTYHNNIEPYIVTYIWKRTK